MPLGSDSGGDSPDVQGGQPSNQRPIYHRLESPSQDSKALRRQLATNEIWGRTIGKYGGFLCVKAYWGALPAGQIGIEFTTDVPPTHANKSMALWVLGYHQRIFHRQDGGEDFAAIEITFTHVTQVP